MCVLLMCVLLTLPMCVLLTLMVPTAMWVLPIPTADVGSILQLPLYHPLLVFLLVFLLVLHLYYHLVLELAPRRRLPRTDRPLWTGSETMCDSSFVPLGVFIPLGVKSSNLNYNFGDHPLMNSTTHWLVLPVVRKYTVK
jgi:hypothetical protein